MYNVRKSTDELNNSTCVKQHFEKKNFLNLPEHYELIFGTRFDNINLYYQLIEVALVGDMHCIKVILNVPLKSDNLVYGLYSLFTFPTEITNDPFVEFWVRGGAVG